MDKMTMKEFFTHTAQNDFTTTTTKSGNYIIQQTERNNLKGQAIFAFADLIKQGLETLDLSNDNISVNVDLTKDGIAVAVYNEHIDQEICFILNPVIPSLTYDSQVEAKLYFDEMKTKQEEKEKKAKAKAQKQERDKLLRAKVAKEKAERKEKGVE